MKGSPIQVKLRCALDESVQVLSVSDAVESLLGFRAVDLVGSAVLLRDRIHPADADIAELLFSLPLEETAGTINIRLRHADGRIRCVRGEYRKTPGVNGTPAILDLLLDDAKSLWKRPGNEPTSVQFTALMENTDDFIFFKDRNHVFTGASRSLLQPFGVDGEAVGLLGQTDYDVFPEKYADIYYRLEKDVFSGVAVASEVHESLKLDGELAWLDNHKYPIKDDKGEIVGLIGVVRDITAQIKAQRELANAEINYRAVFDGAVEGIVKTTMDGRVIMTNVAAVRILGYDSIEDARTLIKDVRQDVWVDPVERDAYLRTLIGSENHTVLGFECRLRRKDGSTLWAALNGRLVYRQNRELAYHDVFFVDITERKQAEEALRASEESLRESQRIAGLGNYVLDIVNGVWTSSDVQDQIFGIDKNFARTMDGWIGLIHPDDREAMSAYLAKEVLADRKPFDREYRIVRPSDGAVRWVHGLGRLDFDSRNRLVKMHGTIRDFTEKKLSGEALRESEESLKEAQRIAGFGSFVVDLSTGLVKHSEELNRLFGIDPSRNEGSFADWQALVHPDDKAMMAEHLAQQIAGGGKPFDTEYRIIRPSDHAVRWMHVRGRVEFDSNGKPARLRGTNQDVTERRQADAALRESKDILQLFITHAPAGLAMLDCEMRYLAVSSRWLEMHLLPGLDIVGKSHYELFPDLPESWKEGHRRALAGESMPVEERRLTRPDGSVQWIRREIIPWRTGDGAVGGIILFSDDITWIKRAEADLRESKDRLQLFIESAPVALAMFDREMRYLTVSPRWTNDRGVSESELIGKTHYEVSPGLPEKWKETHRRGLAGERLGSMEDLYERPDGTIQWIRWEIVPWYANDGSVGGIVMFYEDISERKLAEAALRANTDLLKMFIKRAPASLAMFDREMRYLYVSDRWLQDYSSVGKDVIGHCHYEITPDIPECWKEAHRRGLAGETLRSEEDSYRRADGVVRWIRWEVIPWRTAEGAVGGIILFAEDITRHKENAERLRLAASVFTNAREGILITDPKGNILEVNDMFTRLTGYSREEVIGRNPRLMKSGLQDNDFYTSMWAVLVEEGQWSGELWNRKKSGDIFAQTTTINAIRDADGNVVQYVALFSDVTELKEHQRQLEHVTHYDMLTSLPNRALFADRLRQAMTLPHQQNQLLAVAYLDLDNFKNLNDRYGHAAGDRLLTALAFNMKCALRKGDTLARLGGDEFVAVLLGLNDAAAIDPVLTQLLEAVSEPVQVGESSLQLTASIGVTFYPQKEDVDADSLLRQADQAMYQAKLTGGNRYHIYDPDHDELVRGRHENLEHIRRAMAAREFLLYYQPKVNMRTGKVVGAEALIRWQHPQRGLLPPGMFLPVIEEDPLAVELGEWVIDTALTQIETWSAAGLEIAVSVNVGAMQLQQPNFVDRLSSLLAAHPQVKPFSLELEVLETSALQDVAQTSQVLDSCHAIGVSFALDDFGTGYSSLTYLKRLPVNMLKIDQSFVSDMLEDPENLNILEGVLGLAAAFHRNVIAEGVETVEHGLMLLRLGCEQAQGYGIARPMPARELPGWVSVWRPDPRWAEVPTIHSGNRALLYASVEHRAWVAAFESFLQGRRQAPPVLDGRRCRLGIWLDAEQQAGRDKEPACQSVRDVHRQFHELAAAILSSLSAGKTSDGLGQLGELHSMRDDLLKQLDALRRQY
jgi:diguanylate cyclase (GGDEF)-like protein/PAS domain S-box-containing protein